MRTVAAIQADLDAIVARTVAEIQRDLDAASDLTAKLRVEMAASVTARRNATIKAFDDGATRDQICVAYGLTYDALAAILNRAGRNERQRQALKLSPVQRMHYDKLLRQGKSARLAAQIAGAVT
jgi:hypothetical protein